MRCGVGVCDYANGDQYDGCWVEDMPNGPGMLFNKRLGTIYNGAFVNGLYHGFGKIHYSDGTWYVRFPKLTACLTCFVSKVCECVVVLLFC